MPLEDGDHFEELPDPGFVAVAPDFAGSGMGPLGQLGDEIADLQDAIEDLKSLGGPESFRKVDKLARSLAQFTPSITMIGQIKSGKTSLVNAMAGLPGVLPADVNPWTSVITSLHLNTVRGEDDFAASFQFFSDDEWDHLVEDGGRLGELASRAGADDEVQKVRRQIAEMREKTKARLGRKFELLLGQVHNYRHIDDALLQRYVCLGDDFATPDMDDPNGQFADITKTADLYFDTPGIPLPLCIRDTPGVNDTFMMREQITINALRSSRICVVVLSASQALSSVDMGLIRLISNVESREVIIFVNRIDELANPAGDIAEIAASIRQTLADNHAPRDLKILFGSAYWANMALLDQVEQILPDSAAALESYARSLDASDLTGTPAGVWQFSGLPALFDQIGRRIAQGEGRETLSNIRRRAANHLQGLQASNAIVTLRMEDSAPETVDTEALLVRLGQIEQHLVAELDQQLDALFHSYGERIDQAHSRFLDRALESLLDHLETRGEEELWQYSPDGLRVLLRSNYHMLRRKAGRVCEAVFGSGAELMTDTYTNMLSVAVDGFRITPPDAPVFPPPVTLGQTIALDLRSSWWRGWWQRRRGYRTYAEEFHRLIEAETTPMIEDMKLGQTGDIRAIAMNRLREFLAEQRDILMDTSNKSRISLAEVHQLFGITAQRERQALFEILSDEFTVDDAEPADRQLRRA